MRGVSDGPALSLERKILHYIRQRALFSAGQKALIAVSGGADSVCLALVLHQLKDQLGLTLHLAHLDHQLRGRESEADADYVAGLAARLGLPCTVEKRDVRAYQRERRLSLEEAARDVRYQFLLETAQKVGAQCAALGHTENDQVETLFLHILRGTGIAGLVGLKPLQVLSLKGGDLAVIRPLLATRRDQTEAYCRERGLAPRQDSSNRSPRMLRNRVRSELLPLLQSYNPGFGRSLLRLAEIAAEDLDYLESQTDAAWRKVAARQGQTIIFDKRKFKILNLALQRQALRRAFGELAGTLKDIEARHIDKIIRALDKPTGKRLDLPYGLVFAVDYAELRLGRDPREEVSLPPIDEEYELNIPGVTEIPGWTIEAEISPARDLYPALDSDPLLAHFDADAVGEPILLRNYRRGDRFQPLGMQQDKRVAEFMLDAKVPRARRPRIPIVVSPRGILWLAGQRIDERFKVTGRTGRVLRLRLNLSPYVCPMR